MRFDLSFGLKDPVRRLLAALGVLFSALGLATGWMVASVEGGRRPNVEASILLGLALAWIGALAALRLMRRLLIPDLQALAEALRTLGRGDFSTPMKPLAADGLFHDASESLARLADFLAANAEALNEASTGVRRRALTVSTAAQEMTGASREITSTVGQIAHGMEIQASRTAETSAAISAVAQSAR